MDAQSAIDHLVAQAGRTLDEDVVAAFIGLARSGSIAD